MKPTSPALYIIRPNPPDQHGDQLQGQASTGDWGREGYWTSCCQGFMDSRGRNIWIQSYTK